jgi:hypothetical protein
MVIEISKDIFIDPNEVTAIQAERVDDEPNISGSFCHSVIFDGSIVTLKCGRKIAVNGLAPKQIHAKLWPTKEI